ncbi:hypothetical protein LWI29_037665 [Acer saccharum]|uniref:Uncharacterized protein n=1 Tax=Acer saccharum TaxID=4024 RepID=A0AA39VEX7_ACESA|nr:hypothetical protein LWI29_037665 [Acer saccharum]
MVNRRWGGRPMPGTLNDNTKSNDLVEEVRRYRQQNLVPEKTGAGEGSVTASKRSGQRCMESAGISGAKSISNLNDDSSRVLRDCSKRKGADSSVLGMGTAMEVILDLNAVNNRDLGSSTIPKIGEYIPLKQDCMIVNVESVGAEKNVGDSDRVGVGLVSYSKVNIKTQHDGPGCNENDVDGSGPVLGLECVMEGVGKVGIIFTDEGIGPSADGSGGLVVKEAVGSKGRKWKRAARSGQVTGTQSSSNGSDYSKRNVSAVEDGFIDLTFRHIYSSEVKLFQRIFFKFSQNTKFLLTMFLRLGRIGFFDTGNSNPSWKFLFLFFIFTVLLCFGS